MKELIRYGSILALICMIASGLLAAANSLTKDRIIAQAQAEDQMSLKEVLPEAENFEAVKSKDELLYYKGLARDGRFVGVAFKAAGKGYSSTVETIVGMLKDGTITAIKVVNQEETPGLGARITEPGFTGQFNNKNALELAGVQAITGATISSKAVMDSVKKKAQEVKALLKDD